MMRRDHESIRNARWRSVAAASTAILAIVAASCGANDSVDTAVLTAGEVPTTTDSVLAPDSAESTSDPSGLVPEEAGQDAEPVVENEVTDLQRNLAELGFLTAPVTGEYDPATEDAVRRFQEAAGITSDGIAGPQTAAAIAAALQEEAPPEPTPTAPSSSVTFIQAVIDGRDISFAEDVTCELNRDDFGSITGTAGDGTMIVVTLARPGSRVAVTGPAGSFTAAVTSVTRAGGLLTVAAEPPSMRVVAALIGCI